MTSLTLRATGRASTDLAWRRYADTGRVVGPLGVSVRFEVESVDESAMTWVWRVHAGPITMRLHHAVLPERDGSSTTLTIDGPAPVAMSYSLLAQLALNRLVRP